MFENIGKKLMLLAKIEAIVVVIASIVSALILMLSYYGAGVVLGALSGVFLVFLSWPLYALGQLVDDTHAIRNCIVEKNQTSVSDELPTL